MGAHPYYYFVPYDSDLNRALNRLREREFEAGRYNPAMPFLTFPIEEGSPAPGQQHDTVKQAVKEARDEGTRSILDIVLVDSKPGFGVAAPLPPPRLEQLFGTAQPTRAMVEANHAFFEDIVRGHGIYIVIYDQDQPSEIFFAGYSFD